MTGGLEGRGTTGRALLVAHFWVVELLTGHGKVHRRYCGIKGAIASMNLVRQVGVWATVCVGNARRNALWVGGSRLS